MGSDFKQPVSFSNLGDDSCKDKFKGNDIPPAPGTAASMR